MEYVEVPGNGSGAQYTRYLLILTNSLRRSVEGRMVYVGCTSSHDKYLYWEILVDNFEVRLTSFGFPNSRCNMVGYVYLLI